MCNRGSLLKVCTLTQDVFFYVWYHVSSEKKKDESRLLELILLFPCISPSCSLALSLSHYLSHFFSSLPPPPYPSYSSTFVLSLSSIPLSFSGVRCRQIRGSLLIMRKIHPYAMYVCSTSSDTLSSKISKDLFIQIATSGKIAAQIFPRIGTFFFSQGGSLNTNKSFSQDFHGITWGWKAPFWLWEKCTWGSLSSTF